MLGFMEGIEFGLMLGLLEGFMLGLRLVIDG
jgi:hypothetical protein